MMNNIFKVRSEEELNKVLAQLNLQEYEVNCGDEVIKMKPRKTWYLKPPHVPHGTVLALFECPDGTQIRKKIATIIPLYEITESYEDEI